MSETTKPSVDALLSTAKEHLFHARTAITAAGYQLEEEGRDELPFGPNCTVSDCLTDFNATLGEVWDHINEVVTIVNKEPSHASAPVAP